MHNLALLLFIATFVFSLLAIKLRKKVFSRIAMVLFFAAFALMFN